MNVLVVGSGGREHALVWKIRQSSIVKKVFCAPGNAGIASIAGCVPVDAMDAAGLLAFATAEKIDLTVIGPEQPLVEGIADKFRANGLAVFGPSGPAAALEGSKVFAKQFMLRHNIPTAGFRTFSQSQRDDAGRYIAGCPLPVVIKADGLAAGKGVSICGTRDQAAEALRAMMDGNKFGAAGKYIVVEEFLAGQEASIFAISDGERFITLPPAQDHKRILDDDKGENTGGMGAFAPSALSPELLEEINRTIINPTLRGMTEEGKPYSGCLYVGLMLSEAGPKVVEFNCRFGDPETQAVLPLVEDNFVEVLLDAASGSLHRHVRFKEHSAVCVIMASGGYPDRYETGKPVSGLPDVEDLKDIHIFHSGTKRIDDSVVTSGGRVLGVTAVGKKDDLEGTVGKAYRAVAKISFDGAYYRTDIGKKGIEQLKKLQGEETQ